MAVVDEYLSKWVAPDGGGMIDPDDRLPPFPPFVLETTKNENPILFLVQTALELFLNFPDRRLDLKSPFVEHMAGTRVVTGLHSRRPGDAKQFRQSHDNIVAMVIGSWIFNTEHRHEIFGYGSAYGWNFNVADPYQASGEFDVRCNLQGGDVAICHLACGKLPPIWLVIWLAVGLAISRVWNLADLRIRFLELLQPGLPLHIRFLLGTAISFHKFRRGTRMDWIRTYFFDSNYPFRKIVEQTEGL